MPYIKQERRKALLGMEAPKTAGELNFCLTTICDVYMKQGHKSYQEINGIVGALECCKQEFYRRLVHAL